MPKPLKEKEYKHKVVSTVRSTAGERAHCYLLPCVVAGINTYILYILVLTIEVFVPFSQLLIKKSTVRRREQGQEHIVSCCCTIPRESIHTLFHDGACGGMRLVSLSLLNDTNRSPYMTSAQTS
jgi:hypothetical protein